MHNFGNISVILKIVNTQWKDKNGDCSRPMLNKPVVDQTECEQLP